MRTIRNLVLLFVALLAGIASTTSVAQAAPPHCALPVYRDGYKVVDQLALDVLRTDTNCHGKSIYQTRRIELSGWDSAISNWYGTYNGMGNRISGSSTTALFTDPSGPITIVNVHRTGNIDGVGNSVGGFIGATEESVKITNSSMTGNVHSAGNGVGGFIGGASGGVTISESHVDGDVSGNNSVGGFIGGATHTVTIEDSHITGSVSGESIDVGGLIAVAFGPVTIAGSRVDGNVTGEDYFVGGFIAEGWDTATISRSYVDGNITGTNDLVGGFIAGMHGTATISESYVDGDIAGVGVVSGFIAEAWGTATITESYFVGNVTGEANIVGGLVGQAHDAAEITESYVDGDLTGDLFVGGFVAVALNPVTFTESYVDGGVIGNDYVGGFIGQAYNTVEITDSYTTSDVTSEGPSVGGLIAYLYSGAVEVADSFCLDSSTGCGEGYSAEPASEAELTSRDFLRRRGWDFGQVWCIRDALNNGFPVLRAIDFGPGDTSDCLNMNTRPPKWTVSFDPAGGVCGDHKTPWTHTFRGSYYLPTSAGCLRDGFVLLGWTRDPALTSPENLLTTVVARPGTLTAVWGELPSAPSAVNVLTNFLCRQNCTSAVIVWPTSTNPTDTTIIAIDNTQISCEFSGDVAGLQWCWITGLAPETTHTATVTWRNQYGTGPATTTTFTLD